MSASSIHLTIPGCSNSQANASFSTPCRITLVAIGVMGAVAGALVLFKVPALSSLGTNAGWGLVGGGSAFVLAGTFVKCVKNEAQGKKEEVSVISHEGYVILQQGEYQIKLPEITPDNWKQIYGEGPLSITLPKGNPRFFITCASLSEKSFLDSSLEGITKIADEATLSLIAYRIQNYKYSAELKTVIEHSVGDLLNIIATKDHEKLCYLLRFFYIDASVPSKILSLLSPIQLQDFVLKVPPNLVSFFPVQCLTHLDFSMWSKKDIDELIPWTNITLATTVLDSLSITQINQITPKINPYALTLISSKHLGNEQLDLSQLTMKKLLHMFPSYDNQNGETTARLGCLSISQINTILPKIDPLCINETFFPKKHLLDPQLAVDTFSDPTRLKGIIAKVKSNKL